MSGPPDLPARPSPRRLGAGSQLAGSAAIGIVVAIPIALLTRWNLAPIIAWDLAAAVFLVWIWRTIWSLDPVRTAEYAVPEDPDAATSDVVVLGAALVSLVAVGFVIGQASNTHGSAQVALAALGVASIAVSWAVVHTVFALHYARLYYAGSDGGVDFKQREKPRYSDFAYMAFTIGMTFQVADTDLTHHTFRRSVMRHALLSFVFTAGILATTINLVANL